MNIEEWLDQTNDIGIANWKNKYQFENESFDEWIVRVSGGNTEIARLIIEKKFLFGGRVLANRGIGAKGKKTTYSNCYVLPPCEDNLESIFEKAGQLAKTYSYGGGCGIDLSDLAPSGSKINNAANVTSGALSFAELYNTTTSLIGQSGRRGALMLSMSSEHPDLEEFISIKTDLTRLTKANLSIRASDRFMQAAVTNKNHKLSFTRETGETINKIVNAGEVFDKIVENNWNFGEPGFLFWDRVNSWSLLSTHLDFKFVGTNPCGEEPLPAYGACNLGSFNLSAYVKNNYLGPYFDWTSFIADIPIVVKAMNEVLDENMLLHPLKEQQECAAKWRPIGIGVMGFADLLIKLGIKYGNDQSIQLADDIGAILIDRAALASAQLAEKDGSFPACDLEALRCNDFYRANISKPVDAYIRTVGIRNSQILCIAPTGTLSTMLGISSGMEPIFATQYERKTESLHGKSVKYKVYTPIIKELVDALMEEFNEELDIGDDVTNYLPNYVVTASDIDPITRVKMQAAWQKHIDAAISSTVNLPKSATLADVKNIYIEAWKHGLKGITVFRENCAREGVLTTTDQEKPINIPPEKTIQKMFDPKSDLHTISTQNFDGSNKIEWVKTQKNDKTELKRGAWKKKAEDTLYHEVKVRTGCGKLTLMVGYSTVEKALQDFYIIRSGKGGCERTIQDLVIAMSTVIRLGGRLENLEKGFDGVGTCNSFTAVRTKGFKVLSPGNNCGEAILKAIRAFCQLMQDNEINVKPEDVEKLHPLKRSTEIGSIYGMPVLMSKGINRKICPDCSESMIAESGCHTCKSCGFSFCG